MKIRLRNSVIEADVADDLIKSAVEVTTPVQKSVRHGQLYLIPVDLQQSAHDHGHGVRRHSHSSPRT